MCDGVLTEGCTNFGRQAAVATAFCTVGPNIFGSYVRSFTLVSLLGSSDERRKKTLYTYTTAVRRSGRETRTKPLLHSFFVFLGFLEVNTAVQNTSTMKMVESCTLLHLGTYPPNTMLYVSWTISLNLILLIR
jgi:hypothetical protein